MSFSRKSPSFDQFLQRLEEKSLAINSNSLRNLSFSTEISSQSRKESIISLENQSSIEVVALENEIDDIFSQNLKAIDDFNTNTKRKIKENLSKKLYFEKKLLISDLLKTIAKTTEFWNSFFYEMARFIIQILNKSLSLKLKILSQEHCDYIMLSLNDIFCRVIVALKPIQYFIQK